MDQNYDVNVTNSVARDIPVRDTSSYDQPKRRHQRQLHGHQVQEAPENSSLIAGLDKNMVMMIGVLGVTLGLCFFLYREVRKVRTDLNTMAKTQRDNSESGLAERIEENSGSVQIIEQKLDQLIMSLRVPLSQARQAPHIRVPPTQQQQQQQVPEEQQKQQKQVPEEQQKQQKQQQQVPPQEQEEFSQEQESIQMEEGVCFPPEKQEKRKRKKREIVL